MQLACKKCDMKLLENWLENGWKLLVVSIQFSCVPLHCPQTSLEAAWDAEDAEDAGSDEEEIHEALYSASPSLEHDVEGLSQEGDEGKEGEVFGSNRGGEHGSGRGVAFEGKVFEKGREVGVGASE